MLILEAVELYSSVRRGVSNIPSISITECLSKVYLINRQMTVQERMK